MRRQRTHDGEKHTPLIPTCLHSAAQTDGQALHGHVLELVQAFHLLLISRYVASEIHGKEREGIGCQLGEEEGRETYGVAQGEDAVGYGCSEEERVGCRRGHDKVLLFCGVNSRLGARFELVLIVWGIDVVVDGNYLASQKREFEP
jgi:hypothetical protein